MQKIIKVFLCFFRVIVVLSKKITKVAFFFTFENQSINFVITVFIIFTSIVLELGFSFHKLLIIAVFLFS